jgi:hypothetical protein
MMCVGECLAEFEAGEPLLYPGGFSTADALRDSEWLLGPPPFGWVAYGVTDRLTVAWDWPAATVGAPAGFVRYQFPRGSHATKYALETYAVRFPDEHEDDRVDEFEVIHTGYQAWIRLMCSTRVGDRWRIHLYAGANYKQDQTYAPNKTKQFEETRYRGHWNPDAGVAVEWNVLPWMKIHANAVYGNTFVFVDQVAMKWMMTGTVHFAPFSAKRTWILRSLRVDLNAFNVRVPDARYHETLPIPIYPTVYWQWGG